MFDISFLLSKIAVAEYLVITYILPFTYVSIPRVHILPKHIREGEIDVIENDHGNSPSGFIISKLIKE